ncbi:MAG TPA: hypothetical protein V6C96_01310, partial [Vampirovibrionales bacterium]
VKQFKKAVLKPIGAKAGEGILILKEDDSNLNAIIDLTTQQDHQKVIVQKFLEEIKQGDKRIILKNGEAIGSLIRLPQGSDFRANMAAGGSVIASNLTETDLKICNEIKLRIQELGLYFVGLDVIGDKLTEINITSPTCLEEIHQLSKRNLAKELIEGI